MDPDNRLSITGKIFDIEASLQGILFAVFFVMRGIYAGEKDFITGDYTIPFWLFTATGTLLLLGGVIVALALSHVTTRTPPTEHKFCCLVRLFRLKLGLVFLRSLSSHGFWSRSDNENTGPA